MAPIALFMQEDDPQTVDHLLDIVARISRKMEIIACLSSRHLSDTEYGLSHPDYYRQAVEWDAYNFNNQVNKLSGKTAIYEGSWPKSFP